MNTLTIDPKQDHVRCVLSDGKIIFHEELVTDIHDAARLVNHLRDRGFIIDAILIDDRYNPEKARAAAESYGWATISHVDAETFLGGPIHYFKTEDHPQPFHTKEESMRLVDQALRLAELLPRRHPDRAGLLKQALTVWTCLAGPLFVTLREDSPR